MDQTLLVFLLVYLVMGLGKLPGFKVDRTGAAVIGMLAMIVIGSISGKAAWDAIDYSTIGLLFGLMIVSSTFSVSGFYGWAATKVADLPISPPLLVAVMIGVGAVLSSVLTKDVVAVAMVPLLVSVTLTRSLNPVPFLLAFCFAVNTGSTATLIGSPQNMITAQTFHISFNDFLGATGIPALLSLPVIWALIVYFYRGQWQLVKKSGNSDVKLPEVPALDKIETTKAIVITGAVIIAFILTDWPHEIIALAAGGILLISRRISSQNVLKEVDIDLLLLISGLFVVNAAMAATGLPQEVLGHLRNYGLNLNDPLSLYVVGGFLSNLVGNNPAVILLVPYVNPHLDPDALTAALVLGTGFSSNMIVFGSLAGIITVEQAALYGVKISFMEFFKAGALVTIVSMIMAGAWIFWLAHM